MSTQQEQREIIDLGEGITIEVLEKQRNNIIGRTTYRVIVNHIGKGTPPIPELRVKLAEKMNINFKRIFIKKLETQYGIGVSKSIINIYDDPETALRFEPKFVIERNKTLQEEIEEAEAQEKQGG